MIGMFLLLLVTGCSRDGVSVAAVPTPDVPALQLRTLDVLRATLDEHYVYEDLAQTDWEGIYDEYRSQVESGIDGEQFASGLVEMLSALAAPPVLQTREERLAQASADSSSYGGIGAFVTLKDTPEPHIVLLSIMPDSPAEAAGLLAHDSILAIDGEAIAAGDVSLSIEQMRGEPGSEVTLVARTPGTAEREVVVTRGEIVTTPAEIEIETIGPQENIVYVLFPPAPYANILDGIFAQMETLATEKELAGIIVDLRIVTQNDGWPLAEMFTAFGTGDLGEIYTREETTPLEVEGRDVMMSQTLPMAILVGPDTRGALEMFAAALQSTGRARVLGLPTPGILEGITAFFLPDGSRLFVPTSSYRTADGREVGLDGVVPDILIEAEWDAVTTGDDPVRDAALELLLAETEPAN
jgi:carboxyl-terminal processing protease